MSQHVNHHFDGSSPSCLFEVNLSFSLSSVLQGFVCNLLILFRSSSLFKINCVQAWRFLLCPLFFAKRNCCTVCGTSRCFAQAAVFSVPTRACVVCNEVTLIMTGFCSRCPLLGVKWRVGSNHAAPLPCERIALCCLFQRLRTLLVMS